MILVSRKAFIDGQRGGIEMQVKQEQYDVGVIIARFQVPELHAAHVDLIESVRQQHGKVILYLGLSEVKSTMENPLDFESRKQMVLEAFPDLTVLYIKDMQSDGAWSDRLDEMVQDMLTPNQRAVLYGSRDSFAAHYVGKLVVRELEQEVWISGSEIRKNIASGSTKGTRDWRHGAIWAAANRFPTTFTTVDVALFNEAGDKLLMARKAREPLHRFVGGFADPASLSFEADAVREVAEETGLEISPPEYVASMPVDDWRYRGEVDKIKTLLFKATVLFGAPTPGDDLKGGELRWFSIAELKPEQLVSSHRPLYTSLLAHARLPELTEEKS